MKGRVSTPVNLLSKCNSPFYLIRSTHLLGNIIWVATVENVSSGICRQRRSKCMTGEQRPGRYFAHATLRMRRTIDVHFAHVRKNFFFAWHGPFKRFLFLVQQSSTISFITVSLLLSISQETVFTRLWQEKIQYTVNKINLSIYKPDIRFFKDYICLACYLQLHSGEIPAYWCDLFNNIEKQ